MINFVRFSVCDCISNSNASFQSESVRFLTDELHLVGQQKDGYILASGKTSDGGSFLAGIDIENNVAKVLTRARREINVVCVSISSDQKFLAMSVWMDSLARLPKSHHEEAIFEHGMHQAFLMRLEPELPVQDSWLSVTICHPTVIHVHFLEPQSTDVTLGLLILTHFHSVQLHQVQAVDGVRIQSSQVLAVSFNWAQWLPEQQCLLYVTVPSYPERQSRSLSCIQFCGSSQYSTVFNLSALAVGIKNSLGNESRENRSVTSLNKISVGNLNLETIIWKNGTVCICHQSVPGMGGAWKVSSARQEETSRVPSITRSRHHSSPGMTDCLFTGGSWVNEDSLESTCIVTLLHHGCQVHLTHRTDRPEMLWPMRFIPLDDYQLLLTSPGMPWHLIDIDPSHEPVHYITDDEPLWPFPPRCKVDSVLSLTKGKSLLLDRESCEGFALSLEAENLISLFLRSNSPRNKTSIVHYLSAHSYDTDNIHKLLVAMQQDFTNIETTTFLQEILIGRTFARTKRKHPTCQEILYHLPFTSVSSVDCEDNELHISCMYEHLSTDPLLLASSKSDTPDIWQLLWNYQKSFRKRKVLNSMNPDLGLRPDLQLIAIDFSRLHPSLGEERIEDISAEWNEQFPFCFSSFCTLCSRRSRYSKLSPPDIGEIVQEIKHPFPISDQSESNIELHALTTHTWKELNKFLSQSCPSVSTHLLNKIVTTFIAEQVCQSNVLCNSVFLSCDVVPCEEKEDFSFLEEMPRDRLQCLSALSERFLVAARSMSFPLPCGFSAASSLLTFYCTNFLIFMQYVQNGAVQLQKNVVYFLLKRLDDSPENLEKKLFLIGHLTKSDGEKLLSDSSSSLSSKFYSRKTARNNLIAQGKSEINSS